MVGVDEAHGDSKATTTSARAQQILQQYQAYKQSGGQPAPAKPSTPPPQSFQSSSPQINISSVQLQKTNALRAEQDLPPLQEVSNVRVVEETHTNAPQQQSVPQPDKIKSQAQPKPEVLTMGQKLAQAQGSVKPSGGGGEAVSFLRFPFSPNKGPSSGQVQSTTILDPLQFLLGGVPGAVEKTGAFFSGLVKTEAKPIGKGAADIGLNIKQSEAYTKALLFEKQASRLPSPASIKPTPPPKVPTPPSGGGPKFTSTEINLGRGTGRVISKNPSGGISSSDVFKPSPPPPSAPKPSGKEVTVGKGGLTQLIREKPQVEKPQVLQKVKTEPQKPIQKQKQEPKLLQKQKQEQVSKIRQKQKQEQTPKVRQKQKQELIFVQVKKQKQGTVFPIMPQQKQGRSTQRQPPIRKTTTTNPPPTRTTLTPPPPILIPPRTPPPTLNPPPNRTPPTQPPEPPKRPPFTGLLGTQSGALGKVSKGGSRKGYIGNVPLTSIVGVYKRSEITYGNKAEKVSKPSPKGSGYTKLSNKGSKKFRF